LARRTLHAVVALGGVLAGRTGCTMGTLRGALTGRTGHAWRRFDGCKCLFGRCWKKLEDGVADREQAKRKFGVRRPNDHTGYQKDA
jgi:hypothetical protein